MMRVSEAIRGWLGWCPNACRQNIPARWQTGNMVVSEDPVQPEDRPRTSDTGGNFLYRHSAPTFFGGIKLVLAMVCITIAAAFMVTLVHLPWIYISPFAIGGAYFSLESLYSTVTVVVSRDSFEYWFGRGLMHRRICLTDIERCSVIKNPANFGWSIRATFLEWFYNVSGPDAVEIIVAGGKTIRIGTDEPEELARAINQSFS